ncbi:MAG: hypothetical protein RIG63_07370 [Coleofasciculus chthonoplastes F3-SA18-01]
MSRSSGQVCARLAFLFAIAQAPPAKTAILIYIKVAPTPMTQVLGSKYST